MQVHRFRAPIAADELRGVSVLAIMHISCDSQERTVILFQYSLGGAPSDGGALFSVRW